MMAERAYPTPPTLRNVTLIRVPYARPRPIQVTERASTLFTHHARRPVPDSVTFGPDLAPVSTCVLTALTCGPSRITLQRLNMPAAAPTSAPSQSSCRALAVGDWTRSPSSYFLNKQYGRVPRNTIPSSAVNSRPITAVL